MKHSSRHSLLLRSQVKDKKIEACPCSYVEALINSSYDTQMHVPDHTLQLCSQVQDIKHGCMSLFIFCSCFISLQQNKFFDFRHMVLCKTESTLCCKTKLKLCHKRHTYCCKANPELETAPKLCCKTRSNFCCKAKPKLCCSKAQTFLQSKVQALLQNKTQVLLQSKAQTLLQSKVQDLLQSKVQ